MNLIEAATKLKAYEFRDKHGHPLRNCVDFKRLLAAVSLETIEEIKRRTGELIPESTDSDGFDTAYAKAIWTAMEAMVKEVEAQVTE